MLLRRILWQWAKASIDSFGQKSKSVNYVPVAMARRGFHGVPVQALLGMLDAKGDPLPANTPEFEVAQNLD